MKLFQRLENNPTLWTKEAWARDSSGCKTSPSGGKAVCWCLSSLVDRFSENFREKEESQVRLVEAIYSDQTQVVKDVFSHYESPVPEIVAFNDKDGIDVVDIIRVLKRANV